MKTQYVEDEEERDVELLKVPWNVRYARKVPFFMGYFLIFAFVGEAIFEPSGWLAIIAALSMACFALAREMNH